MSIPSELTLEFHLPAGETDAEGRMPLWLIVSRIIDVATEHASLWGLGYADLKAIGAGWVLSRLSVEMTRYPRINEGYTVTTWVEGFNRLYSDRSFEIATLSGEVVGHVRSMWIAMDMQTRTGIDLTTLNQDKFHISERRSPIKRASKQPPLGDDAIEVDDQFRYCDIDFNRHVNTVQYIRHILDQFPLERYDTHDIARFDIAFHNECRYGEPVKIRHIDVDDSLSKCEILDHDRHQAVAAAIHWRKIN